MGGNRAKTEQMRNEIEDNLYSNPDSVDNTLVHASPHDVTSLLKMFLRELPDPLVTARNMDAFLKTLGMPILSL